LDSERGQGRGLRIAGRPGTWARVSKEQHAVDGYIVNDGGSINDCGDAMRPPPYPVLPGSSRSTTESLRLQGPRVARSCRLVATGKCCRTRSPSRRATTSLRGRFN